jgi:hypothetical protein
VSACKQTNLHLHQHLPLTNSHRNIEGWPGVNLDHDFQLALTAQLATHDGKVAGF